MVSWYIFLALAIGGGIAILGAIITGNSEMPPWDD